jgi:hypothetical protein
MEESFPQKAIQEGPTPQRSATVSPGSFAMSEYNPHFPGFKNKRKKSNDESKKSKVKSQK